MLSETAVQAVYVDTFTPSFYPDHLPLGLEVVQESVPVEAPEGVHAVEVKFTIRNISDEYDPPGWTIEGLYVGLFSDADIGRDMLHYWADDLGGFVPGPTQLGTRCCEETPTRTPRSIRTRSSPPTIAS